MTLGRSQPVLRGSCRIIAPIRGHANAAGSALDLSRLHGFDRDHSAVEVAASEARLRSGVLACDRLLRPLRRRIVQAFEEGWEPTAFDAALAEVDDPKKQDNYAACRKGLRKWAGVSGKRKYEWAGARRAVWRSGPLEVNVSPELWVRIDGDLHIIKLYCKRDKLSQHKVNVALHLLEETVGPKGRVGILDVQQGKLFAQTTRPEGIDLLLASERLGSPRSGTPSRPRGFPAAGVAGGLLRSTGERRRRMPLHMTQFPTVNGFLNCVKRRSATSEAALRAEVLQPSARRAESIGQPSIVVPNSVVAATQTSASRLMKPASRHRSAWTWRTVSRRCWPGSGMPHAMCS